MLLYFCQTLTITYQYATFFDVTLPSCMMVRMMQMPFSGAAMR